MQYMTADELRDQPKRRMRGSSKEATKTTAEHRRKVSLFEVPGVEDRSHLQIGQLKVTHADRLLNTDPFYTPLPPELSLWSDSCPSKPPIIADKERPIAYHLKNILKAKCLLEFANVSNLNVIKARSLELCAFIKEEAKTLENIERYRIIAITNLLLKTNNCEIEGESNSLMTTSRAIRSKDFHGTFISGFLWNKITDNYVEYMHPLACGTLICVVYLVKFD